jgi:nicotinamide-nucleotide amidase
MPTDTELLHLAAALGSKLLRSKLQLVTAESCTGGWIGKVLTDVAGSSAWYRGGAVVYGNELKRSLLGVSGATLAAAGAVSEATVREMAAGALTHLGGEVAVAVTGIAGPQGGSADKPVGTVWFGWAFKNSSGVELLAAVEIFTGDREAVRRQSVWRALSGVLEHQ